MCNTSNFVLFLFCFYSLDLIFFLFLSLAWKEIFVHAIFLLGVETKTLVYLESVERKTSWFYSFFSSSPEGVTCVRSLKLKF